MRNYQVDYNIYSFKAEDDWGYYKDNVKKEPSFNSDGYSRQWFKCTDGKYHRMGEHVAKWEYFNGKMPEGYEIDHIIPISDDGTNKLSNLRLVTHQENMNNPISIKKRQGVNHPMYGKKLTEEHKKKISKSRFGCKLSEETKKKISESGKGKHNNAEFSKTVYQYTMGGEFIGEYPSIKAAARTTGYSFSAIRNCCNGGCIRKGKWVNCTQHKGFKWSYKKI